MQNYIHNGDRITYTIPAETTIAPGDVVMIGTLPGCAIDGGTEGDLITVLLCGVVEVAKTTSLAIAQGDRLYFNSGTGKITKTTSDAPYGIAETAAALNDTTVRVLLYEHGAPAQAAAVASISTADASDLATAVALANANKVTTNAILVSLRAAGLMDT